MQHIFSDINSPNLAARHPVSATSLLAMSDSVTIEALTAGGIVPDAILATTTLPSTGLLLLPVTYADNVTVTLGGSGVTPLQARAAPQYTVPRGLPDDAVYTVVALDLDAPSRRKPSSRCFIHHMQVNVRASAASAASDADAGVHHVPYYPPCPPQNSGKHRYVFLLYRQSAAIDVTRLPRYGMMQRRRQQLPTIEGTLSAAGAGAVDLVAVNWFEAEWELSVNEYLRSQYGWIVVPMLWLMKFRM